MKWAISTPANAIPRRGRQGGSPAGRGVGQPRASPTGSSGSAAPSARTPISAKRRFRPHQSQSRTRGAGRADPTVPEQLGGQTTRPIASTDRRQPGGRPGHPGNSRRRESDAAPRTRRCRSQRAPPAPSDVLPAPSLGAQPGAAPGAMIWSSSGDAQQPGDSRDRRGRRHAKRGRSEAIWPPSERPSASSSDDPDPEADAASAAEASGDPRRRSASCRSRARRARAAGSRTARRRWPRWRSRSRRRSRRRRTARRARATPAP